MSLEIFPTIPTMAWDSKKTQKWDNVVVQKSGSGRRKSLCTQAYPEWEIECSYTCLETADIEKAAGFFAMVKGQFQPFLWLDPEDYQQTKVRLGVGNGSTTDFQLLKNLGDYYVEPVRDIVSGTLTVYVDDVAVSSTLGTDGLAVIAVPETGAVVTASFQYYWRVAFGDTDLDWTNFWYGFYKLNTITVVSVR